MKFCIITAIDDLDNYASLSDHHLVLAQYLGNSKYLDFYQRMRDRGDTLILDNGAYESAQPLDETQFIQAMEVLRPQVVVLPDYPLQAPQKTLSASLRFLDKWVGEFDNQWMICPQAEACDRTGWMQCLTNALSDTRVGNYIGWVGLPRNLSTAFNGWRPAVASIIGSTFPHLKMHALGMANGSVQEMKLLYQLGVYSIDSSAPYWRGYHDLSLIDLQDRKIWDNDGTPLNMLANKVNHQDYHQRIMSNLAEVGIVIAGESTH